MRLGRCVQVGVLAGLLSVVCFTGFSVAQEVPGESALPALTVVPFAVADGKSADGKAAAADLARSACPAGLTADVKNVTPEMQAGLPAALAASLKEKLTPKRQVTAVDPGTRLTPGTLVLTGCLVAIDGGNSTKRIIGGAMGASSMKAHVQLSRVTAGQPVLLEQFDEESKGRNFLVGSGMLINAMRAKRTSITGDAGNLADKIVSALDKHEGLVDGAK